MFKTFEEHYQSETKRRNGRSWAYPKIPVYRVGELPPCPRPSQLIQYGLNYEIYHTMYRAETYHSIFWNPKRTNPEDRLAIFHPVTQGNQSTRDIEALLLEAVSRR